MLTVDNQRLVISLDSAAGRSLALTVLQAIFTWGMQCRWLTDSGFDMNKAIAIVKGEVEGSTIIEDNPPTTQEGDHA
jgi:hypothetical protein